VTPVPTVHLIVGKFLVVATIALLTATLNLASVGATMHFGGISRIISAQMPVELPLAVLPLILLCMVPLALLCSAILVAVCSFARTFKEAQNYVVPVIIGTLVACVPVSMETARLEGPMTILPVGNMVLLARDMLQQSCTWPAAIAVLLSTTLYAAAAIAVAARLFGQEAVLFVDTGSFKNLFRRRLFRPSPRPTAAQAFLLAALVFPVCFYGQAGLSADSAEQFVQMLKGLAVWQFAGLFVILPVVLCLYLKVDVRETLRLRMPPVRAWLAALLLGVSSWVLAQDFVAWQHRFLPPSEAMTKAMQQIEAHVNAIALPAVVLLLAVIPAICEEALFRGFLLSGFSTALKKWPAILASAGVFATFHFMVDRIPLTFLLGTLLAYICWQSRSLLPGILFHVLHNGLMLAIPRFPGIARHLGLEGPSTESAQLPTRLILCASVAFLIGLGLLATLSKRVKTSSGQPAG
jgi:sodium transport system permease protein